MISGLCLGGVDVQSSSEYGLGGRLDVLRVDYPWWLKVKHVPLTVTKIITASNSPSLVMLLLYNASLAAAAYAAEGNPDEVRAGRSAMAS